MKKIQLFLVVTLLVFSSLSFPFKSSADIGSCTGAGYGINVTQHPYTDWPDLGQPADGHFHYLEGLSLDYNCLGGTFDGSYTAFVVATSKTCSVLAGCADIQYSLFGGGLRQSFRNNASGLFVSLPTPVYVLQIFVDTGGDQNWDGSTGRFVNEVSFRDFSSSNQAPFLLDLYVPINTPQIVTGSLPTTSIGHNYSATLQATGGVTPYSWTIDSGTLPNGLQLNSTTGEISGIPTVMGNFNFGVRVTGSNNQSSTANLSISVGDGNGIGSCTGPNPVYGVSITQHPYTDWPDLGQPATGQFHYLEGLSLGYQCLPGNFDGNYTAWVVATSKTCSVLAGCSDIQYSLFGGGVRQSSSNGGQLFSSLPTPVNILQIFADTGGDGNWDASTGRFVHEVSFRDFSSYFTGQNQLPFYLGLYVPPNTPEIVTASLPVTSIGHAYGATLQAIKGTPSYTWTISSGNLPNGLSLNAATGEISGTSTVMGNFSFGVTVTDSVNLSSAANLSISVGDGNQIGACTPNPALSYYMAMAKHPYTDWPDYGQPNNAFQFHYLEGLRLNYQCPTGTFDGNYMAFVVATSKTCTVLAGCSDIQHYILGGGVRQSVYHGGELFVSLPTPINILQFYADTGGDGNWDSATGRFVHEVSYRDFSSYLTGDTQLPFFLDLYKPTITTTSLPDASISVIYSTTLQAAHGTSPYSWTISSGTLPSGLSLNSTTGEISGTPTTIGQSNFTIRVTDSNNQTSTTDLSIQVHGNTPVGNNAQVIFNNAVITYSSVTQEGLTTITQNFSGTQPPTGFKLGTPPTYYHVSTTAQFSGQVEVCLNWQQGQFNNEQNLKLFHYNGTNWVNITESGYPDTINNVICGLTTSFSDFAIFEKKQVTATIDIKPGSYPNAINLGSNGGVAVAIFSTPTFDATTIDPLSVTLASAPIQLKGNGTAMYSIQDVNNDGLLDMLVHVSTQALQLTTNNQIANLEGYTTDQTEVTGSDTVRVIQN